MRSREDRVETGSLWTVVAVSRYICTVNNLCKAVERWVLQLVLDDDRIEAAAAVNVSEFDTLDSDYYMNCYMDSGN